MKVSIRTEEGESGGRQDQHKVGCMKCHEETCFLLRKECGGGGETDCVGWQSQIFILSWKLQACKTSQTASHMKPPLSVTRTVREKSQMKRKLFGKYYRKWQPPPRPPANHTITLNDPLLKTNRFFGRREKMCSLIWMALPYSLASFIHSLSDSSEPLGMGLSGQPRLKQRHFLCLLLWGCACCCKEFLFQSRKEAKDPRPMNEKLICLQRNGWQTWGSFGPKREKNIISGNLLESWSPLDPCFTYDYLKQRGIFLSSFLTAF